MVELKQIATIRTGITQRGGFLRRSDNGNVRLLQPKDITNGELIDDVTSIDIEIDRQVKPHLLQTGDLLLVNKGTNFSTFIFRNQFSYCIASNSFFIIQADKKKCLPEYLQWYLAQPEIKEELDRLSVKTTVTSLTKSGLETLQIKLPSIKTQHKIAELIEQLKKQHDILQTLVIKNEAYKNSLIWETVEADERTV